MDRLAWLSFILIAGNVLLSAFTTLRGELKEKAKRIFFGITLTLSFFLMIPAWEINRVQNANKLKSDSLNRLKDSLNGVKDSLKTAIELARFSQTKADLDTTKKTGRMTLEGLANLINSQTNLLKGQITLLKGQETTFNEMTGGDSKIVVTKLDFEKLADSTEFFLSITNLGKHRVSEIAIQSYFFIADPLTFSHLGENQIQYLNPHIGLKTLDLARKDQVVLPSFKVDSSLKEFTLYLNIQSRNRSTDQWIKMQRIDRRFFRSYWTMATSAFEKNSEHLLYRFHDAGFEADTNGNVIYIPKVEGSPGIGLEYPLNPQVTE